MNDKEIIDIPSVAFHGVQNTVTNVCKWQNALLLADMGESAQKCNRWIQATSLELPAVS